MGSSAEQFGPYVVYEQLGFGGMATVHRAETKGIAGFSKQVALKRMLPSVASNAALVKSFIREAQLASLLRHGNVAQTYDLGKVGDTYFIAMELVPGRNLRELLKHCAATQKPMPVAVALNILTQICDALDYAHELCDESGKPLGIIHRDVSPSNIIVSEGGVVKLIDFGIAKASSQASGMNTQSGTIKGKFSYMAPEYLGGSIDARADLFAVGVIGHELLANRPLFQGKDDIDTLYRLKDMPILPPSRINPKVPTALDHVIMTALARDPEQRWQRANALRQALATEIKQLGLVAHNGQVIEWIDQAFAPARASSMSDPQISITSGTTELSRDSVPDDFLHTDPEAMATIVKPSGSKPIQKQSLAGWKPKPADWKETDTTSPHTPSIEVLERAGKSADDWKPGADPTKLVRKSAPIAAQTPAKRTSTPNIVRRNTPPAQRIESVGPDDADTLPPDPASARANVSTESDAESAEIDDAAQTLVPTRSAQVAPKATPTPAKTPVYRSQNEIVLDELAAQAARNTPLPQPSGTDRSRTQPGPALAPAPYVPVPMSGSRTTPHLPRASAPVLEPPVDAGLASLLDDLDANPGKTGVRPLLPTAAPPPAPAVASTSPQGSVVETRVAQTKPRGNSFLLAVLVLIAAAGAAAVVYFALPYLTS